MPSDAELFGKIRADPVDLRDLEYHPNLQLLPERFLCVAVDPQWRSDGMPKLTIRNQQNRTTCVGEALAAVIDIQRIERAIASKKREPLEPVSAAMLYTMALAAQRGERPGGRKMTGPDDKDLFSIRAGLKGFYNAGVCAERLWEDKRTRKVGHGFDLAEVEIMKKAREIMLGAYYRVRHLINHYHAAIAEAGALYVSANAHDGWGQTQDKTPKGVISMPCDGNAASGGHAFAIVGYNEEGFLVLNSWGADWGGYEYTDDAGKGFELKGISLWRYEDWAGSVLDAWAIRLAVPTPGAFQYAVGEQGLTSMPTAISAAHAPPRVRQLDMIGRYVHLDDGHHVGYGAYPSSRKSFETTLEYLRGPKGTEYEDIIISLHGDISNTSAVLSRAGSQTDSDRRAKIYRISFIWTNDLLFEAERALQPLFFAAMEQTNGPSDDCDELIVKLARPLGKALCRDILNSARIAVIDSDGKPGDAAVAINGLAKLCRDHNKRLHLVVEGVGILLLHAFFQGNDTDRTALVRSLSTVSLVRPVITETAFKEIIAPFFDIQGNRRCDVVYYRPSSAFERRLRLGPYTKSWKSLIANSFLREGKKLIKGQTAKKIIPGLKVTEVKSSRDSNEPLDILAFLDHRSIKDDILNRIYALRLKS